MLKKTKIFILFVTKKKNTFITTKVFFLLFKTFYLKYYKNFSTLKSFQGAKSVGGITL